jgi:hypothetical protein
MAFILGVIRVFSQWRGNMAASKDNQVLERINQRIWKAVEEERFLHLFAMHQKLL